MYRKVVFSKDPEVLRLDAVQHTSAYISLNQTHSVFRLGTQLDAFGIYKASKDDKNIQGATPYLVIAPQADGNPCLTTGHLKSETVASRCVSLGESQLSWDDNKELRITVPESSKIVFQSTETPWCSISRHGVGIGTVPHPLAALHINGTLYCNKVVSLEEPRASFSVASSSSSSSPTIPLDASGKIPMSYLPEVYQTTLIQNDVGVGIGTRIPCQKLHVEGGGYIRDRLRIGASTEANPTAVLDMVGDGGIPVARIRSHGDTATLVVIESTYPIALFESQSIQFHVPTSIPQLTVLDLEVKDKLYHRSHQGWYIPEALSVANGITTPSITTPDHTPFHIHAPVVAMETLKTKDWCRPMMASATPATPILDARDFTHDEQKRLFESMAELRSGLFESGLKDARWDWNIESWQTAYANGQELAKCILTPDNEMRVSSTLAFLWAMVQQLNRRVSELESRP